jgi:hypothetical protein
MKAPAHALVRCLADHVQNMAPSEASLLPGAANQELTASLNVFPAENLTVFAAGISASVAGLRSIRSARLPDKERAEPDQLNCVASHHRPCDGID